MRLLSAYMSAERSCVVLLFALYSWFSEEMLETCDARKPREDPLAGVENDGLSFEEFLFLAECNGAHVRAFRASPDGSAAAGSASLSRFRAAIHSATHRTDLHLVASFSRKVLGQTGSGHYSPVGALHVESDMALVLDVARFKYPPYWAPVSLLWKAVGDIDEATGRGRGYYLMSKGKSHSHTISPHVQAHAAHHAVGGDAETAEVDQQLEDADASIFTPLSTACRIAVDKQSWSRLAEHFCSVLPNLLYEQEQQGKFDAARATNPSPTGTATNGAAVSSSPLDLSCGLVFRELLHSLPVELSAIFIMYTHDLSQRMVEQYQRTEKIKTKLQTSASAAGGHADAAESSAATAAAATNSCDATHSCAVHTPSSSSLSIYHTLLPKHTPHTHSHSIPTVHALHPLLHAIAQTKLFAVLREADIDLQTVEYKHKHGAQRQQQPATNDANSSSPDPISAVAPANASAEGGLGFHLLASSADGELELAALLLLACPHQVFSLLRPSLQSHLSSLRLSSSLPLALRTEVSNLRAQMGILSEFCACGAAPSVRGNENPNVDPRDVKENVKANQQVQARSDQMHLSSHAASSVTAAASAAAESAARAAPAAITPPAVSHRFVGARAPRASSVTSSKP